jgi:hypothetical protein
LLPAQDLTGQAGVRSADVGIINRAVDEANRRPGSRYVAYTRGDVQNAHLLLAADVDGSRVAAAGEFEDAIDRVVYLAD